MVMTEDFESSSLGSIPSETFIASLAQLVERTAVNREVTGSNPVWSEKKLYSLYKFKNLYKFK